MSYKNIFFNFLAFFLCASAFIYAQEPTAQIVYADNEQALSIVDAQGNKRSANIGDNVREGETIFTSNTTAELRLNPNGTIIRLSRNTNFRVETLANDSYKPSNIFKILTGKLRTIATRTKENEGYIFKTPTAICGVRGTDFSIEVIEGKKDLLVVSSGLVSFSRKVENVVEEIHLAAGQYADALAPRFRPLPVTEEILESFTDLEFQELDPAEVEQDLSFQIDEENLGLESQLEEDIDDIDDEEIKEEEVQAKERPALLSWLGDILGFEVGAISIHGQTYAKAVIQPTFNLGKAKVSLYLPVIYTNNLFDPDSWYQPGGNNEWSFGSEYWGSDPLLSAIDFAKDLALKIRYIEYGNRWLDPLYLNIGNLSTMSIGHGIIMRNFANDSDFPAIRRIGLNTGLNRQTWGLELVANDLAEPDIFGLRFKFAKMFGISAIADINPGRDLEYELRMESGYPLFLAEALDFEIPIVKTEALHLLAFADIATMLPYTRRDIPSGPEAGWQTQAVYDPNSTNFFEGLRNYGFMTGVLGKFLFVDYRLEYRLFRGTFRPAFFDASYERMRGVYARDLAQLLSSPAPAAIDISGIYGEAGFNILKDKLSFLIGYMAPWSFNSSISTKEIMKHDYILAKLVLSKGLIPAFDLHGSLAYQRNGFVSTIMDKGEGEDLFDANTVFKGELIYPITTGMDLAALFTTAALRDSSGNVVLNAEGRAKTKPSLTFETRIRF